MGAGTSLSDSRTGEGGLVGVVVGHGGHQQVRVRVRCWKVLSDNGRGMVPCPLSKAVGTGCGLSGFNIRVVCVWTHCFHYRTIVGVLPCRWIIGCGGCQ